VLLSKNKDIETQTNAREGDVDGRWWKDNSIINMRAPPA